MAYDRNPPAPLRFLEGQPIIPGIPVQFHWPTIADLVLQRTAIAENFLRNP